jgi:uncharacterized secreted protein with C-terminal beta-propeller domain
VSRKSRRDLSAALELITNARSARSPEAAAYLQTWLQEKGVDDEDTLELAADEVVVVASPLLKEFKLDMLHCLLGLTGTVVP